MKMGIDRRILTGQASGIYPAQLWPEAEVLVQHLARLKGDEVVVLLNKGNRGDGVIHEGGLWLLRELGVRHRVIRYPERASGGHLLAFGCGAFSRYFNHMTAYIDHYRDQFAKITILPASFETASWPVKRFLWSLEARRFCVFCRERKSLEGVRALRPDLEDLHLAPDLAFFHPAGRGRHRDSGSGVVAILRTDEEQHVFTSIEADVERDFSAGPETEPELLFDAIAPFRVVHTDRLHAAVCATLLEKEVNLYEGAYHKNRAIYEFTLSRFPNVKFRHETRALQSQGRRPGQIRARAWSRARLRVLSILRPLIYRFRFLHSE